MSEGKEKRNSQEGTVDIFLPPSYDYNLGAFDNEASSPDLAFVIQGLEKPLRLHKSTVCQISKYIERVLREKRGKGDDENKIEWVFDVTKDVDKQVIVKALKFCYGESVNVGVKDGECCAMISVLKRLEVVCEESISNCLIAFARDEAKKELNMGVDLLRHVQEYQECIDKRMGEVLATVVFTKKNIMEHFDVVRDCLMILPSEYLDMVEYEEGYGERSEFGVKKRYLREHKELEKEEKERIVKNCKWDNMSAQELKELKELDAIGVGDLWDICEALLKREEKEIEKQKKELEEVKSEEEKQRKQSLYCLFLNMKTLDFMSYC